MTASPYVDKFKIYVGAFSVIVKTIVKPIDRFIALEFNEIYI